MGILAALVFVYGLAVLGVLGATIQGYAAVPVSKLPEKVAPYAGYALAAVGAAGIVAKLLS